MRSDRGQHEREPVDEVRIPLSIVLMVAGAIILITAGFIYTISPIAPPADLPGLIPLAQVPRPTATRAPLPTLMAGGVAEDAIFLPQTPPDGQLPSEARVDEAPTQREPRPGEPVRIEVPALGIDAPVWPVGLETFDSAGETFYRWQVPNNYAAGWHSDSALLGRRGNTVLNGHHNIYGSIFRNLSDLEQGDEIIVYDQDGSYHYRVEIGTILPEKGQPMDVRRANAQWMDYKADERLTIVSCWPVTDNTHRVVVVATPVE